MKPCWVILLLLLNLEARAASVSLGFGQFQGPAKPQPLYLLELKQDDHSFGDFKAFILNHSDGRAYWDGGEASYQGLGFGFDPLYINLDIGYLQSLGKYVVDEVDWSTSRSILGGRVDLDLFLLHVYAAGRRYIPSFSRKIWVDSFSMTLNPEPYTQLRAGCAIPIKNIQIEAETGRFQDLHARLDFMGTGFPISHDPVSYGRASVVLRNDKSHARFMLEWHQILGHPEDRPTFQKLLGTALQRDAFDGGLLGLGLDF